MKGVHNYYSLPGELEPDLSLVHAYGNGLKPGANDVPGASMPWKAAPMPA